MISASILSGKQYQTSVLVVAPQFPAINQPWIDTYLEQLLANEYQLSICSSRDDVGEYSPKVDRLKLRDRVVLRHFEADDFRTAALNVLVRHPLLVLVKLNGLLRVVNSLADCNLSRKAAWFKALAFLDKQFALPKTNIIHCHGEFEAFEVLHFSLANKIPLITTFHGLQPPGMPQLALDKRAALYQHCKAVLVNTRFAERQVVGLGCPPDKVRVIPQGLPLDDFPFYSRAKPKSKIRLLAVGRLQRDKGHAYTLGALRRMRQQGLPAELTIVGVGSDKGRLEKLASLYGVADSVRILQGLATDALMALYKEADIFVLASINNSRGYHVETQGVVLQESQASGLAVVATRVGGIPECLDDRENAYLVKHRSSRAIADACSEIVGLSDEAYAALLKNGRQNVERRFAASVVGKGMSTIIKEILAQ